MSTNIYESDTLYLTEMVGPAAEGSDRRRWQLTVTDPGGYAVIDAETLADFLAIAQASLTRRGGVVSSSSMACHCGCEKKRPELPPCPHCGHHFVVFPWSTCPQCKQICTVIRPI